VHASLPPQPGAARTVAVVTVLVGLGATACAPGPEEPGPEPEPDTVTVAVYLTNEELGDPCGDVFPVDREVGADDPVTGALEALLAGPTADERADDYGGWFTAATADALLDVEVVDGTAHVTFTDLREIIPNASTSCGSAGLLAQLDRTLLALDGVEETRYAIADQGAFYAWLQLDDPDAPGDTADVTDDGEPSGPAEPTAPDEPPPPDEQAGVTVEVLAGAIAAELETGRPPEVDVEVTCDRSGTVRPGDVLVCSASSAGLPETDWGAVVVAVVDETRFAWTTGTDQPATIAVLRDRYADTPHGLLCRDLLRSEDVGYPFSGIGRSPEEAFFWALVYWNLEGQPARMDVDGDGVPCGSLFDPEVTASVVRTIPRYR
jgi:hypothetical protein